MDWAGELEGDWRVDEPLELLELLELLDEFDDELDELELEELDELEGLGVLEELVPDELAELLDVLSCDDVPESLAVAWVDPGSTAISAPVTATLAKDTVMVVAFRRRLPCSRSATARAISRLFMSSSLTRVAVWTVRGESENALSAAAARALLGGTGLESWPNGQ